MSRAHRTCDDSIVHQLLNIPMSVPIIFIKTWNHVVVDVVLVLVVVFSHLVRTSFFSLATHLKTLVWYHIALMLVKNASVTSPSIRVPSTHLIRPNIRTPGSPKRTSDQSITLSAKPNRNIAPLGNLRPITTLTPRPLTICLTRTHPPLPCQKRLYPTRMLRSRRRTIPPFGICFHGCGTHSH
jgi:hypothetical protein